MSALIEWNGAANGGPFANNLTIDFSNELPGGGAFTVVYGFRTVDTGLGTLTLQWNWTDPSGNA